MRTLECFFATRGVKRVAVIRRGLLFPYFWRRRRNKMGTIRKQRVNRRRRRRRRMAVWFP